MQRLEITNIRAIDHLTLDFPAPRWPGEADIHVLGSANGVGKTTVLEAAALAMLTAGLRESDWSSLDELDGLALGDLFCRAGESEGRVVAGLRNMHRLQDVGLGFRGAYGGVHPLGDRPTAAHLRELHRQLEALSPPQRYLRRWQRIRALLGHSPEPLIEPGIVFFHSYRKVTPGALPMGSLIDDDERRSRERPWRSDDPISTVKLAALRALLANAGLLERVTVADPANDLQVLNELLRRFAQCELADLRPDESSALELRVRTSKGATSHSFDALSSGQKEIIGTLFLVWLHTKDTPAIVLIDEPELHLNAEWHAQFVQALTDLAPRNQYILATHSRFVFAAVPEDRRLLLRSGDGGL